jgi:hypothetical protein
MSGNTPAPPRVPRPLVELNARHDARDERLTGDEITDGQIKFNPEFERMSRVDRLCLIQDWIFILREYYSALREDRDASLATRPDARAVRMTLDEAIPMRQAREERGIAGKTMPAGLPESDDD